MLNNNENSVLFSIGSVIELQQQKELEQQAEVQRQKIEQKRAETARADQARQAVEETQRARLAEAAESARHEWEKLVADKEAAIRSRIEADTQRELEMLRAEYRDAEPLVVPGRNRLSFAVASLVALAVIGLGAFGVHAMTNDSQPPVPRTATATTATPSATQAAPRPKVLAPAPVTTVHIAEPTPVKIHKPVTKPKVKPRPIRRRPRCKWITITKRVQHPLWNHPLNFEGRYKIIKKRVKKCRK